MLEIAKDTLAENSTLVTTPDDFKKFINMDVKPFRKMMLRWYFKNKEKVDSKDVDPASMMKLLNGVSRK